MEQREESEEDTVEKKNVKIELSPIKMSTDNGLDLRDGEEYH